MRLKPIRAHRAGAVCSFTHETDYFREERKLGEQTA
jgi:hypothetical protein